LVNGADDFIISSLLYFSSMCKFTTIFLKNEKSCKHIFVFAWLMQK